MNDKIEWTRGAIEYLQKCKPLIEDDLVEEHDDVYAGLTLLLKELIYEDSVEWEAMCPHRKPVTPEDLSHPLIGEAEKSELAERLYRVLHIVKPAVAEQFDRIFTSDSEEFPELQDELDGEYDLLIYDVEKREVVCRAGFFFYTMNINEFSWRG